ncbi:MAG: TonB-dependent receptor [Bacteroidetes bacterium]|nr:TonB-dependent receptor [Bacteroidota bacterium]
MRLVLFYFLVFSCFTVSAQVRVGGTINNHKSKPLIGISISLKDTYDGATTDSLGNFSFTTNEKGNQTLVVTSTEYKPYEKEINLDSGNVNLNITLKEQITSLKAVVISVGAFEASDQKKGTVLNPVDIVTTASANGDITSAIKTLPGTQQVGESEGLFVRGGTADETKYYIDGTLVNNFYYSSEPGMATRGRFNPFLFKGTIFSSGGYSALYGQALSSVLLLESIDFPDKTSASFGVSYLSANAGIQALSKNKKSSWGITYDYTNLALVYNLIKQKYDYFRVPVIHNADANFRIKTSATGILKYYGIFSTTNVAFRYQDIDSLQLKNAFHLNNFNTYHNISWREKLGKGWRLQAGASYSNNIDKINSELQNDQNVKLELGDPLYASKNFNLERKGNYVNGKVVLEKKLFSISTVRFGNEYNMSDEKTEFIQSGGSHIPFHLKENIEALFAETDLYITNDLALKVGVRSEHSSLLHKWNFAPRVSFAYKFADKSQASIAYGQFYQDPNSLYLPALNALHFVKATHYIAQYQKITNNRTFRTELFYKKYDDLIKTQNNFGRPVAINNDGFGDAKGVEVFWRDKKTFKNLDYWVSYSYLDTKRDFLNYPFSIQPPFASKHTASLVLKKFILPLKTQFNASYTYATGRPYYNIMSAGNNDFKIVDQGRTRDYNSLSLSMNYLPNIGNTKAKAFGVLVLSVTNVLGFNNIYSYNYSANGQNKVAVLPAARRFYFIGYFISLGIDRSEDAINNHL